jgi:uncharacterized protein YecE (DUF72 family)
MAQIFAGTSGFAYSSWKPDFYPKELKSKDFLSYYSQRLNSTEVNYTFRQVPKATTLENWVASTPPQFVFSLKAHMRLTHILKLKDAGPFLEVFLRAVGALRPAGRLGPILFQLSPQFQCDAARLRDFVALLPRGERFAFEFRHPSWFADSVYQILADRGVCLCLAESDKLVVPEVLTAGFFYARLRKSEYSEAERHETAGRCQEILASGKDVYVYYKHEESPAGALYAQELLRALGHPSAAAGL